MDQNKHVGRMVDVIGVVHPQGFLRWNVLLQDAVREFWHQRRTCSAGKCRLFAIPSHRTNNGQANVDSSEKLGGIRYNYPQSMATFQHRHMTLHQSLEYPRPPSQRRQGKSLERPVGRNSAKICRDLPIQFCRDVLIMSVHGCWCLFVSRRCSFDLFQHDDNRRKFRSQTSDNMDRWKAEMGRVREKRRVDADARKGRKVAKHCVFPMICGSWGSKSRLAKAAGAEPSGQMRYKKLHAVEARSTFRSQNVQNTPAPDHFWKLRCRKSARRCGEKHISKSKCTKHLSLGPLLEVEMSEKCTPLWREAHFAVKMYKTLQLRTTFGSWDVEKVHAVVARSTFRSQNVQNTSASDHFWKLRCRKSARRCGARHISKSKCIKHIGVGPLLEVAMSKKCTPLWREAHFQVKMYKTHHVRTTFGGSDVVSRGRRKGLWTLSKVSKMWGFCSIFNYNHHYTTLHSNTLHYTTTTTTPSLHSTTLHSTALHCTQLHSITLHYTTLHYTPLHYTTLHYTTLHNTTLHYITLHYLPLHYITLHYITLHSTTLQLQLARRCGAKHISKSKC